MKRLTQYISNYPHGAEGVSEDRLTGSYCRGYFEATAIVKRLAEIEDVLGDEYSIDELRKKLEEWEPVRHAHWEKAEGAFHGSVIRVCSGCGKSGFGTNYCPHCGAKMDCAKETETAIKERE